MILSLCLRLVDALTPRTEYRVCTPTPDADLVGHVSWWCDSREAREWRGTSIPGGVGCPFWERPPSEPSSVDWIDADRP